MWRIDFWINTPQASLMPGGAIMGLGPHDIIKIGEINDYVRSDIFILHVLFIFFAATNF